MKRNKLTTGMLAVVIFPFLINAQDKSREMVKIPAGSFIMGMDYDEDLGNEDCTPKHKVYVDAFYMDKYEITQGEYKKLMGKNPSATKKRIALTEALKKSEKFNRSFSPVGKTYPVIDITWYDAARYCNARSRAEGLEPCYDEKTWECDFSKNGYRLPTEAEWEYACRAGSDTKYFFGNDKKKLIEYANYWPDKDAWNDVFYKNGYYEEKGVIWNKPMPRLLSVGSKKPNKWGLYDMLGNAREWCNDWYDENYYKKSPVKTPHGPKKGEYKVLRGGGFNFADTTCSYRDYDNPIEKSSTVGFRCVRNAPKDEKKETEKKDAKDKKPGKKSKDKGEE